MTCNETEQNYERMKKYAKCWKKWESVPKVENISENEPKAQIVCLKH